MRRVPNLGSWARPASRRSEDADRQQDAPARGESRGVSSIVCVDLTVGRVQNRQCVLAAAISVAGSYGHQVEIDR